MTEEIELENLEEGRRLAEIASAKLDKQIRKYNGIAWGAVALGVVVLSAIVRTILGAVFLKKGKGLYKKIKVFY